MIRIKIVGPPGVRGVPVPVFCKGCRKPLHKSGDAQTCGKCLKGKK